MSDGSIRNTYDVRLLNKNTGERHFRLFVKGDPALRIRLEGTVYESTHMLADSMKLQRVYVIAPPGSVPAQAERIDIRFWVEDLNSGARAYADTTFNGKGS